MGKKPMGKKPMGKKPMGKKRLRLLLTAGAVLLLLAGLCIVLFRGGEPERELSQEEQFLRNASLAFDPTQSTLRRFSMLYRAAGKLDGVPKARRRKLVLKAMADGTNGSIDAFRALPESEKPARAALLHKDALRTRDFYRSLPEKQRRRARELLRNDPEIRAEAARMVHTVVNRLNDSEKKMLSPVLRVWQTMLMEK